jgi:putative ABC transport system permease protein
MPRPAQARLGDPVKIALRELRRRPGRFVTATVILSLIAILLMFLGGLVDGLLRDSTGAVRSQQADLIVFSADAKKSFLRSRIDPPLRATVEAVPGVEESGGIGVIQLGARVPGRGPRDLADTALFGYQLAPSGVPEIPPPLGEVIADESLESAGVRRGMTIALGPYRTPVTVVGFVTGTNYLGQSSLWGSPETWRMVVNENRAAEALPAGSFQSLVLRVSGSPGAAAHAIDAVTQGATTTLTVDEAANAIPGVKEQRSTFNQIIAVTVVIAVVVVALFFALLTVERTSLYGVLKAVGAGTPTLFAGVVLQALVVTLVASFVAAVLSFVLAALVPPGSVPFVMTASRAVSNVALLVVAAIAGCAFSLRRVLRIDPASAIGVST